MGYKKQDLLGKSSYPGIVEAITEKIRNAQAETLSGSSLLTDMYAALNESQTPIMDLKPFITGGEKIASDDATIADVIDFCKKSITTGDLNFVINLCKEEHFKNMSRMNHPSPKDTVKDIQDVFDEPVSFIEQGIKSGLFDGLQSKLLNSIKNDLGIKVTDQEFSDATKLVAEKTKKDESKATKSKLNESEVVFNGPLVKYSKEQIRKSPHQ